MTTSAAWLDILLNGRDSFSSLSFSFVQPAVAANVVATVSDTSWMAVGQTVYITGGGYYTVVAKADAYHVSLTNQGQAGSVAPGITVPTASAVSPGGQDGGASLHVKTKTSNYTAVPSDVILCDTSAGGFTITLPDATVNSGRYVVVKKVSADSNTLTIVTTSAQLIRGSASATSTTIATCGTSYQLFSGGVLWDVI